MNSTKFREYINNPVELNKAHETDLKELLDEFPYFNAAQVMLAKLYKNEENFRFERQLKLAAMHAGDRTLLFDYLNAEPAKAADESKVDITEEPVNIVPEVKDTEPVEEKEPENEAPVVEDKEEEVVRQIDEIVEKVEEEVKHVEPPKTMFTLATDEEVTETEEEDDEPVSLNTEVHIKPDIQIEDEKEEEPAEEPIDEVKDEIEATEEKEEATSESVSFYDWLAKKSHREEESKQIEEEAEKEDEKVDVDSIIGKFLETQPTITKPKVDFYNPTDMARRSVEDSNDIVSESLAKLYLKQKLFKKAIDAYEKLCLLIPEKSETFASQIKKIKEEHNLD